MTEFVQELVAREAAGVAIPARRQTGEELITVCALVRGLADDLHITRDRSPGRSVDLS